MATQLSMLPQGVAADPLGLVSAINDRLRRINLQFSSTAADAAAAGSATGTPGVLTGTRAARLGSPVPPNGSLYIETDHTNLIYLVQASAWQYFSGIFSLVQVNLAAFAATLGAPDTGLLVQITDYAHVLEWAGIHWQRGPGDTEHSDSFHYFGSPPLEPYGWHACDGTPGVPFLNYAGGLGTRDLPNTNTNPAYTLAAGVYSPVIAAPTVPTLTMEPISFSTDLFQTGDGTALTAPDVITPAGTITLPGDPVANFPMLLYYRQ